MKKRIAALVLLVCLLTVSAALADTLTDWNRKCTRKLGNSTTLYTHVSGDDAASLCEAGQLEAGTYIRQQSDDEVCAATGTAKISYCTSGGSVRSGYVSAGAIVPAVASIRLTNGQHVNVPEALTLNQTALNDYLWDKYKTAMQGFASAKDAAASASAAAQFALYLTQEGGQTEVRDAQMGLAWSQVTLDGETIEVRTADLEWGSQAPEEQRMAVVYAPKSGKASVYADTKSKKAVLCKAEDGLVLMVLNVGERYAKVWVKGHVGYMLTTTLTFHAIADAGTDGLPGRGVLSSKGKTEGRAKISVKDRPKSAGRVVQKLPIGTPVTVFSDTGNWAEVDAGGYHGFIQSKYLTMMD